MSKAIRTRFQKYFPLVRTTEEDFELTFRTAFMPELVEIRDLLDKNRNHHEYHLLLLASRRDIVGILWLYDLWRDPWKNFVNTEFPGPDLNDADILVFVATHVDYSDEEQIHALKGITDILSAYGYIEGANLVLANLLAARLSAKLFGRSKAQALIAYRAVHPAHPAWDEVLEKFFTAE